MTDSSETEPCQRLDRDARFIIGAVAVVLIILAVILLPEQLVALDSSEPATAEQINAARRTLVQFFGGFAVLTGLWLTARRIRASERRAEALEDQIRVTEQGQVTERFTRAIEQLGSDNLQIRLGGIYSLERIANDSPRDLPVVIEVLAAFLREHVGVDNESNDYQSEAVRATFNVLSQLSNEDTRLDLKGIKLTDFVLGNMAPVGIRLDEFILAGADLSGADLRNISLGHGSLENSNLTNANLSGLDLSKININDANFTGANLQDVSLKGQEIKGAKFIGASLQRAKLSQMTMKKCSFRLADLEEATLNSTILSYCNFDLTNLKGAEAKNLITEFCSFRRASFQESNFTGARFAESDLSQADLSDAKFTNTFYGMTDLIGTTLENTNFRGADFEKISFGSAATKNADFRDTDNFTAEKLAQAAIIEGIKLDDDVREVFSKSIPSLNI